MSKVKDLCLGVFYRESEVNHFKWAKIVLVAKDYVLWFYVTVDDIADVMKIRQSTENSSHYYGAVVFGQTTSLRQLIQSLSSHLHLHDEVIWKLLVMLVYLDNIGMM